MGGDVASEQDLADKENKQDLTDKESQQILIDNKQFIESRVANINQIKKLLELDSSNQSNHRKLFQSVRSYALKAITEIMKIDTKFKINEDENLQITYIRYVKELIAIIKHVNTPANANSIIKNLLLSSIREGKDDSIQLLLKGNANLDIQDEDGSNTVIAITKCGGSIEILQTLIENNADINHPDKSGKTALMHAVKMNRLALVQELLKHKPDIDVCDQSGKNALVYALESERLFTVELSHKSASKNEWIIEDGRKALQILEELLKHYATFDGIHSFDLTDLTSQSRIISRCHTEYIPPENYFCSEKITKALLIIDFLDEAYPSLVNVIAAYSQENKNVVNQARIAKLMIQDPYNLTLEHIFGLDNIDLFTDIYKFYLLKNYFDKDLNQVELLEVDQYSETSDFQNLLEQNYISNDAEIVGE